MKIRVFNFTTCKLKAVFNEDLSAAEDANDPTVTTRYVLEDIDLEEDLAEKSLDVKFLRRRLSIPMPYLTNPGIF